jgi:hypothetical protein
MNKSGLLLYLILAVSEWFSLHGMVLPRAFGCYDRGGTK